MRPCLVAGDQLSIVLVRLVRIVLGKAGDGFIEARTGAQICRNLNAVAGSRVGAGQRLAAHTRVDIQSRGRDRFDGHRSLEILELPPVKIPALDAPDPAEEDVRSGLHAPLSDHHPLAVVWIDALARIRFEHRRFGFLDLEEQWILSISSFEQHDVAARPNTADADNLSSDVHRGVLLEQVLAIGIQAFQVFIEGVRETAADILADHLGWHALNQRRVIHNPAPPVHDGGQFLQRSHAGIATRLHDPVLRVLLLFGIGQHAGDVVDRQVGVPDREIAQCGKSAHRLAVRGDRREGGRPALRGTELVCARCDDEAGGQALDIPFERTGQCLIEVVDVEHQGPFGRRRTYRNWPGGRHRRAAPSSRLSAWWPDPWP